MVICVSPSFWLKVPYYQIIFRYMQIKSAQIPRYQHQ
uniref:Receptor-like protein kinase isoform X1 n=1 Tax=Rhizophora mucronata TaxID=61149 RepID=A0A2P2JSD9_RHIMU